MSTEANKLVARRFYAALNNHDLAAAAELIDAAFIAHLPGMPDPLDREGYRQVGAMFLAALPDLHLTLDDVIAEGDRVVTRMTERGTHQGEFMGIPPTGRQVAYTSISMDRIVDGTIVEHWVNFDALGLLQQLGAIPAPGQGGG